MLGPRSALTKSQFSPNRPGRIPNNCSIPVIWIVNSSSRGSILFVASNIWTRCGCSVAAFDSVSPYIHAALAWTHSSHLGRRPSHLHLLSRHLVHAPPGPSFFQGGRWGDGCGSLSRLPERWDDLDEFVAGSRGLDMAKASMMEFPIGSWRCM